MMTSLVFMLFILLLALSGVQCHFLQTQVKRRSGITITRHSSSSQTNIQYNQHRHRHPSIAVPIAFLSIRGGSSDNDDIDDDFADFVSSFESELVDIRREAELEAEAELEELRRMLANQSMGVESEREEEEEEEEEDDENDDDQSAADDNSSDDNNADEVKNNDTDEESSGEETKNTESDDEIPSMPDELDVSGGDEAISDGERTDEEMIGDEEEYDNVVHSEDESVEDLDEPVNEDAIINDLDDTSKKQIKSKKTTAKKRSKSNKLASKSAKKSSSSSRSLLDHIEPLSEDEAEISESVVLTRTIEKEVETRPRGISGYLKSDLARALALLVATVIISVWMQRLQRQMEAQGI